MLRARDATRALGAASAQRFQARSPASAAAPAPPEAPEPLDPAQAVADAAAAAAGGRVRPCAAAPRPGRGREAGRAPARARARAPAAGASQVVRARVLAAGLRAAARQRSSFRLARGSQASRPIERGSELQWRWPRRRAGVASAASTPPSSAGEMPTLPSLEETRPLRRLSTHSAAPGVPGGSQSPGARAAESRADVTARPWMCLHGRVHDSDDGASHGRGHHVLDSDCLGGCDWQPTAATPRVRPSSSDSPVRRLPRLLPAMLGQPDRERVECSPRCLTQPHQSSHCR